MTITKTALLFSALMLAACAKSTPLAVKLPPPPAEALKPCVAPEIRSGTAQAVERALREDAFEIASCDAKRRALIDAWPK